MHRCDPNLCSHCWSPLQLQVRPSALGLTSDERGLDERTPSTPSTPSGRWRASWSASVALLLLWWCASHCPCQWAVAHLLLVLSRQRWQKYEDNANARCRRYDAHGVKVPARLSKKSKSRAVRVVVTEEFLQRLEEWRQQQPGLPNKSEAIRWLCKQALANWTATVK